MDPLAAADDITVSRDGSLYTVYVCVYMYVRLCITVLAYTFLALLCFAHHFKLPESDVCRIL